MAYPGGVYSDVATVLYVIPRDATVSGNESHRSPSGANIKTLLTLIEAIVAEELDTNVVSLRVDISPSIASIGVRGPENPEISTWTIAGVNKPSEKDRYK